MSIFHLFSGRKGRKNAQYTMKKGFLLLEIMIALVIFSMLVVVITHYHWQIVKHQGEAIKYIEALNKARAFLENIPRDTSGASPGMSKANKANENILSKDEYTLTWKTYPVDSIQSKKLSATKSKALPYNITQVNVAWKTFDGKQKSITLTSGYTTKNTKDVYNVQ